MKEKLSSILSNKATRLVFIPIVVLSILVVSALGVSTHLPVPSGSVANTPDNQPWNLRHLPAVDSAVSKLIPDGTYNFSTTFNNYSAATAGLKTLNLTETGVVSFKDGQCAIKSEAKGLEESTSAIPTGIHASWDIQSVKAFDSDTFTKVLAVSSNGKPDASATLNTWQDGFATSSQLSADWLSINIGLTGNDSAYSTTCSLAFLSRIATGDVKSDGTLTLDQNKIIKVSQSIRNTFIKRQVDAVTNKWNFLNRGSVKKNFTGMIAVMAPTTTKVTVSYGVISIVSDRYQSDGVTKTTSLTTVLTPADSISIKLPTVRDQYDEARYEKHHPNGK